MDRKTLQHLGGSGYRLERAVWLHDDAGTLKLHLKPTVEVMYCQRCGSRCRQVHETTRRDFGLCRCFQHRLVLVVAR
jgi:transposase